MTSFLFLQLTDNFYLIRGKKCNKKNFKESKLQFSCVKLVVRNVCFLAKTKKKIKSLKGFIYKKYLRMSHFSVFIHMSWDQNKWSKSRCFNYRILTLISVVYKQLIREKFERWLTLKNRVRYCRVCPKTSALIVKLFFIWILKFISDNTLQFSSISQVVAYCKTIADWRLT